MKTPWFKSRNYLHFDAPISKSEAVALVFPPKNIESHSFYPFIHYTYSTCKVCKDNNSKKINTKKIKNRELAYASHKDSHIFSYYSNLLSEKYEKILLTEQYKSINDSILAFRKLNKGNIEFANDAFELIRQKKNCTVLAFDIASFFDNLDHNLLKEAWCKILGLSSLPKDHYNVFKALTQFTWIDRDTLYSHFKISIYNPRKNGRYKICNSKEFREFRKQYKNNANVFHTNKEKKGIPQGSPISAMLSNIYMINFDKKVKNKILQYNGHYLRYCDDILCIIPTENHIEIKEYIESEIQSLKLHINKEKTEISTFVFCPNNKKIVNDRPLQYLGFTLHNSAISIRSKAIHKYIYKMHKAVKLARQTQKKFNYIRIMKDIQARKIYKKKLYRKYSHLGRSNFIYYGKRASKIMNSKTIKKQLKPLWSKLNERIERIEVIKD